MKKFLLITAAVTSGILLAEIIKRHFNVDDIKCKEEDIGYNNPPSGNAPTSPAPDYYDDNPHVVGGRMISTISTNIGGQGSGNATP